MKNLMQWNNLPTESNEWLEKVRALNPLIIRHRDYSEQTNATHKDVMSELFKEGFGRTSVSRAFGGSQVDIQTTSAMLLEFARHDASVSWQLAVQVAMGRLSDYLPEQTSEAIYSTCTGFVIGAIHSGGEAVPVGDDYLLNGKWAFASGSAYADWLVCTATVKGPADGSAPEVRMFFVPASQCKINHTWDTLGMRGTGSHHFECEQVLVNKAFSLDVETLKKSPQIRCSRAYATGYYEFGTLAAMSTVLGVARAAVDHFRNDRAVNTDPGLEGVIFEKTGRAISSVHTAQLLLEDAICQVINRGETIGDPVSARVGLAASVLTENSVNAVNQIYALAGSKAVYKSHFLERCFRDIHTGSKHFTLSPLNLHGIGKFYLDKTNALAAA
ncbi:acyl-CoA dehydrogenase family protein [Pseudomonas frederiksbergensis]|uniref:acyl-CoA dehydrogenase family protein n=1 Tax=Pseudomonas frederiksbergensis TaxID=104087 RepID=UPI003D1A6AD0